MKRFYLISVVLGSLLLLSQLTLAQRSPAPLHAAAEETIVLGQNFPNPSTSFTKIPVMLQKRTFVKVEVYNLIGAKVATLHQGELPPGRTELRFDTSQLKNGVYIYRLSYGDKHLNRRMTVSR
ncbi:MAG: T9SS C-terminal target domain-containing protein [Bacteroidetes bacterium]|nr:MAG: T9SS C-terminal target domain-containing protein [Bacteroidota bacterium]